MSYNVIRKPYKLIFGAVNTTLIVTPKLNYTVCPLGVSTVSTTLVRLETIPTIPPLVLRPEL